MFPIVKKNHINKRKNPRYEFGRNSLKRFNAIGTITPNANPINIRVITKTYEFNIND